MYYVTTLVNYLTARGPGQSSCGRVHRSAGEQDSPAQTLPRAPAFAIFEWACGPVGLWAWGPGQAAGDGQRQRASDGFCCFSHSSSRPTHPQPVHDPSRDVPAARPPGPVSRLPSPVSRLPPAVVCTRLTVRTMAHAAARCQPWPTPRDSTAAPCASRRTSGASTCSATAARTRRSARTAACCAAPPSSAPTC